MDPVSILLFVLLFALSAFFSGSEIAFMSLPQHKIETILKQKLPWSRQLAKLKANSDRLLITILIWNNLVNVLTASLATKISIEIANSVWSSQSLAIWISTWVITLFLLLFGEIFPKTFATRYAEKISLATAPIYTFLEMIFFPIIFLIEKLMRAMNNKDELEHISEEEVESFIELSHKSWTLEKEEYEKIKNLMNFYELTAEDVMTPRVKINWLSSEEKVCDAIEEIKEFSHSRIPIYEWSIDNVFGVVRLKQLLKEQDKWNSNKSLRQIDIPEILKCPITQPIHIILETFRKKRQHIALVMDEYGWVAGVITLEDIIEEVFGDIKDETDMEKQDFQKLSNGYIVQADIRLEELFEKFDIDFDEINIDEKEYWAESVWYFITSYLKRLPKNNENIKLEFVKMKDDNETKQTLNIEVRKIENDTILEIFATIK